MNGGNGTSGPHATNGTIHPPPVQASGPGPHDTWTLYDLVEPNNVDDEDDGADDGSLHPCMDDAADKEGYVLALMTTNVSWISTVFDTEAFNDDPLQAAKFRQLASLYLSIYHGDSDDFVVDRAGDTAAEWARFADGDEDLEALSTVHLQKYLLVMGIPRARVPNGWDALECIYLDAIDLIDRSIKAGGPFFDADIYTGVPADAPDGEIARAMDQARTLQENDEDGDVYRHAPADIYRDFLLRFDRFLWYAWLKWEESHR